MPTSNKTTNTVMLSTIELVPSQNGTLIYNGKLQSPAWDNFDGTKMTIFGDISAIDIGTYTVIFEPRAGFCWSDNTVSFKHVTWSIVEEIVEEPDTTTSYDIIYNRFLQKITDFNIVEVDDYSLDQMLHGWLMSAATKVRKCENDLSLRDDELGVFLSKLNDTEIELLACGMTLAWIDQYLNSTELTLMMVSGKEEKFYSQANHLTELRALRADTMKEMHSLHCYYTYTNNSYFDN